MGKDKVADKTESLETLADGMKKFLVEFEVKQTVITTQVVEAKTRTDAEKKLKANADSISLDDCLANAKEKFPPLFVGKSVRAKPFQSAF